MALTTHPNQLDSSRGVRAGLIGLAAVLFAAVAALGYSVITHDVETTRAVVDFPTVDDMRAENMEMRHQAAAAAVVIEAHSFPSNDEMLAENQIIREQAAAAAAADDVPTDTTEGPVQRPTRNIP